MPDAHDLHAVVARLLGDAEEKFGILLRDVLKPVLMDAFQQGVAVGFAMSREGGLRGIEAAERNVQRTLSLTVVEASANGPTRRHRRRRQKQRVAPGTVRPIVELILSDQPGLRVAEVQAKAAELDQTISPTSIGNELRRHQGKLYRQEGRHWYLMTDATRKELAEDRSLAAKDSSLVERPSRAAA